MPPAVVAAIERALDKNRDARFPDVNSFVKAVTSRSLATAPGTETATRPQTLVAPVATVRIPRKQKSSAMPIVAVLGLAVLGSVGFVVWKNNYAKTDDAPMTNTTSCDALEHAHELGHAHAHASPEAARGAHGRRAEARGGQGRRAEAGGEGAEAGERAEGSQGTEGSQAGPEAAKDLADAQAALDAGKHSEAIRLAQHSLFAQKTSRAYAMMTRARCAQGDLGNARAALAQVAARDRSSVLRACAKAGIDLK